MKKSTVYNGEVVGFTAGKIFIKSLDFINIHFKTQEEAEKWCEDMTELDSTFVYFPIKLTALSNSYLKEKVYD